MSALKTVVQFFAVPDDPDLVLAQARALTRQIPLLYSMLLANSVILAVTHANSAPVLLTVYVPAVLAVLSMVRLIYWWRHRHRVATPAKARKQLSGMIYIAAAMSIGFTAWSIGMFHYGDAYQQSHIAFYMGITTIGCMFCLMHVRAASFVVGICVLVPFTLFFATVGNGTFTAIAVNMVLVVGALVVIMLSNYRDFSALVASRSEMAGKHAETQRLSDENDRLANVDSLTDLPNRRWFNRRLEEMLAEARRRTIARSRWRGSIWIASRRSTTFLGRSRVTVCWSRWADASWRCGGPRRSWRGWGPTISR